MTVSVITSYRGHRIRVYEDRYLVTTPDGRTRRFTAMSAVRRWIRTQHRQGVVR